MTLDRIISGIKEAQNIAILPHVSADGDAIGSGIALALALGKEAKGAVVILEEDIPTIYGFLPGIEKTEVYPGREREFDEEFDMAIALDAGDLERLGKRVGIFDKAAVKVNIDHHSTNTHFGQLNHVDVTSSAVGEIIFDIIKKLGLGLDAAISTCLYVAIATDTGGFRYSNTTPRTHRIASELIENGVNVAEVSQKVFETTSLAKVKLMGEAISSLQLFDGGKTACITLTDHMMARAGASEEDCDGIVNIARNIMGVEAAVMFRPEGKRIKVNLRSNSYVDVSAIAARFNGGGHKRAAGCVIEGDMDIVKEQILDSISKAL